MLGTADAFERSGFAQLAIDGDSGIESGIRSSWRRNGFSIVFDNFYLVDRIELVVTQLPRWRNYA